MAHLNGSVLEPGSPAPGELLPAPGRLLKGKAEAAPAAAARSTASQLVWTPLAAYGGQPADKDLLEERSPEERPLETRPDETRPDEEYPAEALFETISGQVVNLLDPDPDDLLIEDIAWALAFCPRFAGHVRFFYSTGQHSYEGSLYLGGMDAYAFLFHDASEAYLHDITQPFKAHLNDYRRYEDRFMRALSVRFGFPYPLPSAVKEIDQRMYETEERDVRMKPYVLPNALPCLLLPRTPEEVRRLFLERYHELKP